MKIAVCTPNYSLVHSAYSEALARLVSITSRTIVEHNGVSVAPQVEVFMRSSSTLPDLRNALVAAAIDWKADYLLWIDADHVFPDVALLRLMSLNLPVVGANYPKRGFPTAPTAVGLTGELIWTTEDLARNRIVEQVASLGLGLCLMDMSIVNQLNEQALAEGRQNIWPLFATEGRDGSLRVTGEDVFFFNKLREAGVKVFVDHGLSWSVGHVYEVILTNADALAQKEEYLRSIKSSA